MLVAGLLLLMSQAASAQRYYRQSYTPKQSVFRSRDGFNSEQFSFGVNALYYYGDAEVPRAKGQLPVVSDFSIYNINASAFFAYHRPFNEYVGLRCAASLGLLRGDNTSAIKKYSGSSRKFTSVFLQPAVGVQIYPIENYGLYFYAGVGLAVSHFIRHQFTGVTDEERPSFSFLPMGQASIGYAINLTSAWRMDLHGTFEMGFCDIKNVNLDGWPVRASSFNSWPDGWFALGVTFYFRQEKRLPRMGYY
ncbi:MAG: hypothetical protein IJ814_00745 [Paludibacteraceae bacterium]|nr:hypothetical protein [Paludibacteraceae bacterium]